ncbi:polysaccharide deacetylase [Paraburkholderia phymatum]|uniref:Polysaccharide deacetylase n=1 Tax=Paraburkholderia phymatum (strain DSM 17167 / CIP 108236 / LMG 21445 / STM815) TaxID=391038 RepID=B2JSD2_PARP8|nr:polysaccharide deacetylase [Paraburkholderia phymatum]ACC73952.1 polysaccharide deacetylase [Paraburkholderia phymatum STM815]
MTTVCLTFDFDAVAIWFSTFKQTTPTALSRGEYGVRAGIPRILAMLSRQDVRATFFTPAHTARNFGAAVKAISAAGHEVAAHGFVHETPVGLPIEEERDLLHRSLDVLESVTGKRPRGYRSPAWDLSDNTISLLEEAGLHYDSSMMANDFRPYFARKGDVMTEDRLTFGSDSSIVEFPVAWELDDYPYFHWSARPINPGLRSTEDVFSVWKAEFDAAHAEDGVFTLTCHPEISGRAPRVAMLERLIEHMRAQPGVRFATMDEAARQFKSAL